jgi:putative Mg2+ transporter-C (MgtC) family protein
VDYVDRLSVAAAEWLNRNDTALEQIIGRMSLEPFVTAAHWQAEQAPVEN